MKKLRNHISVLLTIAIVLSSFIFTTSVTAEGEKNIDENTIIDEIDLSFAYDESNYENEFIPGNVIITLKQDTSSADDIMSFSESESIEILQSSSIFDGIEFEDIEMLSPAEETDDVALDSYSIGNQAGDIILLELTGKESQDVIDAINILKDNDAVLCAEPDYIMEICETTPNDEYFNELWGMERISAPKAWDTFTGSSEVIVGVIDTGVDYTHPDLVDNIWVNEGEIPDNGIDDDRNGYIDDYYGWQFGEDHNDPMDYSGHGTHVAGTIAGVGNNDIGVAGVAWNAKIASLNISYVKTNGVIGVNTGTAIKAITYSKIHGFDVINASWGGPSYSNGLNIAIERFNGIFVAGAGNYARDNDEIEFYPASYECENIIAVASIDQNDGLAYFSNSGATSVDLAAPGVDIYSTIPGGGYGYKTGTSMSSPHVAGAAALLKGYNPSLSGVELKEAILSNVKTFDGLKDKVLSGGRLDLNSILNTPDNGTANDGIINPGKDKWWDTSITWRQYAGIYEDEPYFPQCKFKLDSIDVICKNQTYTVPSKTFIYDEIGAIYDYEKLSEYDLCVKVYYDGNAEYILDDWEHKSEMGMYNEEIAYFDDYALIPVVHVYSDKNGQLFGYSAELIIPRCIWWTSAFTHEDSSSGTLPYAKFMLHSHYVIVNGKVYTVPAKTYIYRPKNSQINYALNTHYAIAVRVHNNGTAEYILTQPWFERGITGPIYDDSGVIIPIMDVNTNNYEFEIMHYWFTNNIHYPGDGIVYPGKDFSWDTSITWRQYAGLEEDEPYFQQCKFKMDSIDVICKNKTYTVPSKDLLFDVIGGNYDYDESSEYDLCVKVNYKSPYPSGRTAEYYLDPGNREYEAGPGNPGIAYFDDYALLPIARVYSDKYGQLFLKSFMRDSVYTNGQKLNQISLPVMNTAISVKDIAVDRATSAALSVDGDVYTWGDGAYYDLGHGEKNYNLSYPKKVNRLPKITKIAKGKHHVLALDVDGNVWGWGNNSSGEIHSDYKWKVYVPSKISNLSNIVDIEAGSGFSIAIKDDGTVWTWGNNTSGKLGDREIETTGIPSKVIGLENVSKVACGENFAAALSGNTVYTWGDNTNGQLGDGTNMSRRTPMAITGSYTDMAAGYKHMLATSSFTNELYTWGYNSSGQLGLGDKVDRNTPTSTGKKVTVIGAGNNHTVVSDGTNVYACGRAAKGQLGLGNTKTTLNLTAIKGLKDVVEIDGGYDFTAVRDAKNQMWLFGSNETGQLGIYWD